MPIVFRQDPALTSSDVPERVKDHNIIIYGLRNTFRYLNVIVVKYIQNRHTHVDLKLYDSISCSFHLRGLVCAYVVNVTLVIISSLDKAYCLRPLALVVREKHGLFGLGSSMFD
ncbi:hypothetical protein L6452_10838 [Arctium lappa]|uniref:Uncharacterized protein n=1 Tax=Arctium lappa TaxID=4217 RepID=A0ACB9DNG7_ARCLA|nr:hypothetical protein L6452_10838 [Arctium lappa]